MGVEKAQSSLKTRELELAAIMKMLSTGITSLGGGGRLERWLYKYRYDLNGGFGTYDALYLRFNDNMQELAKSLITFLKQEEIGSTVRWVKTKDAPKDEWLLQICWE